MKLIDYDKHRTEIQKKVMAFSFDPALTCREVVNKTMELLDSLPADYTEANMKEVDRAYQRVCKELNYVWNEKEEQRTAIYTGLHRIITERISQIQTLLLQYPDFASMIGRLDELNMLLAECEKMAAETNCENRMFRENLQAEPKLCGKEKPLKQ